MEVNFKVKYFTVCPFLSDLPDNVSEYHFTNPIAVYLRTIAHIPRLVLVVPRSSND